MVALFGRHTLHSPNESMGNPNGELAVLQQRFRFGEASRPHLRGRNPVGTRLFPRLRCLGGWRLGLLIDFNQILLTEGLRRVVYSGGG